MYFIQHCFICRPSDSTVSEDARNKPRTVATLEFARRSNHSARSHPSRLWISSTKPVPTVQECTLSLLYSTECSLRQLKYSYALERKSMYSYVFLFWELGGLSPNFRIHVFLSDLVYRIFPGSVHIFPAAEKADLSWEYINRSQTHECGN